MLARTTTTADSNDNQSFSYGPGPAQIASDGVTGLEYDANGARVQSVNIDQVASYFVPIENPPAPEAPVVPDGTVAVMLNAGALGGVVCEGVSFWPNTKADGSPGTRSRYPAVMSDGSPAFAGSTTVQVDANGECRVAVEVDMNVLLDVVGLVPWWAATTLDIRCTGDGGVVADLQQTVDSASDRGHYGTVWDQVRVEPTDTGAVVSGLTAAAAPAMVRDLAFQLNWHASEHDDFTAEIVPIA